MIHFLPNISLDQDNRTFFVFGSWIWFSCSPEIQKVNNILFGNPIVFYYRIFMYAYMITLYHSNSSVTWNCTSQFIDMSVPCFALIKFSFSFWMPSRSIGLLSADTDSGVRKIRKQMKIFSGVKNDNIIFIIVRT